MRKTLSALLVATLAIFAAQCGPDDVEDGFGVVQLAVDQSISCTTPHATLPYDVMDPHIDSISLQIENLTTHVLEVDTTYERAALDFWCDPVNADLPVETWTIATGPKVSTAQAFALSRLAVSEESVVAFTNTAGVDTISHLLVPIGQGDVSVDINVDNEAFNQAFGGTDCGDILCGTGEDCSSCFWDCGLGYCDVMRALFLQFDVAAAADPVNDASSSGNHGTIVDTVTREATSVSPVFGNAFKFTGGGIVDVADDPMLNGMDALSIEFWINPHNTTGNQMIVAKRLVYEVEYQEGSGLHFTVELADGSSCTLSTPLPFNTWTHFLLYYSGTWLGVFRDGGGVGGSACGPGPLDTSTFGLEIGRNFVGDLDDLQIWRTDCSADVCSDMRVPDASACP